MSRRSSELWKKKLEEAKQKLVEEGKAKYDPYSDSYSIPGFEKSREKVGAAPREIGLTKKQAKRKAKNALRRSSRIDRKHKIKAGIYESGKKYVVGKEEYIGAGFKVNEKVPKSYQAKYGIKPGSIVIVLGTSKKDEINRENLYLDILASEIESSVPKVISNFKATWLEVVPVLE